MGNINEEEVNIWYNLSDSTPFNVNKFLNFETFCFFYNYHRIFYKYNMEKPLQISKDEVMKAMSDTYWPEEYLEVSNIIQRLRLNERDFYIRSFLEVSDESNSKSFLEIAADSKASKAEKAEKTKVKVSQDASASTAAVHNKTTINQGYWDKKPNMANRKVYFDTMTGMDKRLDSRNFLQSCKFVKFLR